MAVKNWIMPEHNSEKAGTIAKHYDIPLFLAEIMVQRGYDSFDAIDHNLTPDINALHDPFLMSGMKDAVARIELAIERKEIVTIFGDYDVDGITSVSLLYLYLTSRGLQVYYYIPDRIEEGYGVNCRAIDKIRNNGSTLIISVDTGITACDEVEYAKTFGIDFIITDHHECSSEIPNAVAVCNPKRSDCTYPFRSLAGVGVVFKLICALHSPNPVSELIDRYLDLVALGTISDVMPVVDENRLIVREGLKVLSKNHRGLSLLMQAASIRTPEQLSVFDVSFLIAPRINAAGRIGDSLKAVQLLVSDQPKTWQEIADYLCDLNNRRQQIEANIFEQADNIIREKKLYRDQSALILWKEGWHHGVIGIVASRIKEKYGLPTILFTISDGKAKGSGRSMEPLNLYSALSSIHDVEFRFGGHAMAAGITMPAENLHRFKESFCAYASDQIADTPYVNSIKIDAQLFEHDFSLESFSKISMLEPFGTDNEVPLLLVKNAIICDLKPIGNQRHMRLVFRIGSKRVNAVYFGMRPECFALEAQSCVDVLFQASINEFRGKCDIQLIVKGIRSYEKKYLQLLDAVSDALSGNVEPEYFPDRNVIVNVYRFCKKCVSLGMTLIDLIDLPVLMKKFGFGYHDVRSILPAFEILEEIGVVQHIRVDQQIMVLSFDDSRKVSLEHSTLYRKMHG